MYKGGGGHKDRGGMGNHGWTVYLFFPILISKLNFNQISIKH